VIDYWVSNIDIAKAYDGSFRLCQLDWNVANFIEYGVDAVYDKLVVMLKLY
jgi:hypothetical protein